MLRLLCILLPPLAVLLCRKPMSALLNLGLCLLIWLPGVIHAWGVVSDFKADERMKKQVKMQAKMNEKSS